MPRKSLETTTRQRIVEDQFDGEELLFADGFDAAIVAVAQGWFPVESGGACQGRAVVYDLEKYVGILVRQGLDSTEAMEYLEFNAIGAYVGQGTPLFLTVLR